GLAAAVRSVHAVCCPKQPQQGILRHRGRAETSHGLAALKRCLKCHIPDGGGCWNDGGGQRHWGCGGCRQKATAVQVIHGFLSSLKLFSATAVTAHAAHRYG